MVELATLRVLNEQRWAKAVLLKPLGFAAIARKLCEPNAKARYVTVQTKTGVPWYIIAVIHEREASQNWNTQLGQGDPLDKRSIHVPAGRGPFRTWEEGAYDALVNCGPYAARNKDWSPGGALTLLETFNGLGYSMRGVPSPYIWSGTDQYKMGKYVADGRYDPNVIDPQLGCAGLLKAMMEIDSSIAWGVPAPIPTIPVPPVVITTPPKLIPVPPVGFWATLMSLLWGKK
jgi:lysozyme family protein